ncbi:hypothetical protein RF11_04257 [Thelohanellus kitauei]|uniref:Uncharacterized protein n=1 Tax=Thelohanellus kitauei TaxID=669202 RepID=A0A0C2IY52_THEKT|nr:hypothetical protein RF11_04257 [Thelohanellus kitauei]
MTVDLWGSRDLRLRLRNTNTELLIKVYVKILENWVMNIPDYFNLNCHNIQLNYTNTTYEIVNKIFKARTLKYEEHYLWIRVKKLSISLFKIEDKNLDMEEYEASIYHLNFPKTLDENEKDYFDIREETTGTYDSVNPTTSLFTEFIQYYDWTFWYHVHRFAVLIVQKTEKKDQNSTDEHQNKSK